jgi:hypothetical protein
MYRVVIGALALSCCANASAQSRHKGEAGWCNAGPRFPEAAWVPLTDYVLIPVSLPSRSLAIRRLRNGTIRPLSAREAHRLLPRGHRALRGRSFLVRGGVLLPPGRPLTEAHAKAAAPDNLQVLWSARHRAIALNSYTVFRRTTRTYIPPQPYNVPLILATSARPQRFSMTCTSAD